MVYVKVCGYEYCYVTHCILTETLRVEQMCRVTSTNDLWGWMDTLPRMVQILLLYIQPWLLQGKRVHILFRNPITMIACIERQAEEALHNA